MCKRKFAAAVLAAVVGGGLGVTAPAGALGAPRAVLSGQAQGGGEGSVAVGGPLVVRVGAGAAVGASLKADASGARDGRGDAGAGGETRVEAAMRGSAGTRGGFFARLLAILRAALGWEAAAGTPS